MTFIPEFSGSTGLFFKLPRLDTNVAQPTVGSKKSGPTPNRLSSDSTSRGSSANAKEIYEDLERQAKKHKNAPHTFGPLEPDADLGYTSGGNQHLGTNHYRQISNSAPNLMYYSGHGYTLSPVAGHDFGMKTAATTPLHCQDEWQDFRRDFKQDNSRLRKFGVAAKTACARVFLRPAPADKEPLPPSSPPKRDVPVTPELSAAFNDRYDTLGDKTPSRRVMNQTPADLAKQFNALYPELPDSPVNSTL